MTDAVVLEEGKGGEMGWNDPAVIGAIGAACGAVLTKCFDYLRGTRRDAGELTLRAWVMIQEDQRALRSELLDQIARLQEEVRELKLENQGLQEENERLKARVQVLEAERLEWTRKRMPADEAAAYVAGGRG